MGDHLVKSAKDREVRTRFIKHLLNDIKSMELMLERGLIETGINRIGAEQELCLITKNWRPAKNSEEILAAIDDPHFTTELARFNLEINLDPVELKGNCFSIIHDQIRTLLNKARNEAKKQGTLTLLTGILPTISKTELEFEYMTPQPRYWLLNELVRDIRGSDFHLHIKGVDELAITHDSVLMEACNTSFQLHLQVDPNDFVASYNWAQAISGPMLGVCANSPLLLGRELWSETRIALFQQSIDTRMTTYALKDQLPRVSFGEAWETGSPADVFKNDVAQHKIILAKTLDHDSLEELESGKIPKLEALNIHNGTIYRWNRPCYGVGNGKAHLRIENRYIPSGPSVIDEMANFAYWIGLMMGRPAQFDNINEKMEFRDVKSNFIKAARTGKESVLRWEGELISVRDLTLHKLLPLAHEGLKKMGIDKETSEKLLDVIEKRTLGKTGAQWSILNYRNLRKTLRTDDALLALTRAMQQNQLTDMPVHEWPEIPPHPNTHEFATMVGHIMSTRLFTVYEDDLAEMATQLMIWKDIHHVPVENNNGEICGLLTWTHLKRYRAMEDPEYNLCVGDIMAKKVFLAHTEMPIPEAIALMKQNSIGCLPVVHNQHLVGIVTIKDIKQYDKN